MVTKHSGRGRTPRHGERHGSEHELHQIKLAIDRMNRNQGKWLSLIVQVLAMQSPPDDPRIAELTAKMRASNDELQMAIDAATEEAEQ